MKWSLLAVAALMLPSCAGWTYKGSVGYDKFSVSAEFYRPHSQGKQPVQAQK